jgi:uncharacterized protein (TIGR02145 family)
MDKKKLKFSATIIIAMFSITTINAQRSSTTDDGLVIFGIKWATRNVDAPGTFADTPESFGRYYTWDEAQNVCPKGWRLPTSDELRYFSHLRRNIIWKDLGISDEYFNTFYLPAAGYGSDKATINYAGSRGYYWSSSKSLNTAKPEMLYFYYRDENSFESFISNTFRSYGYSVRCVAQ